MVEEVTNNPDFHEVLRLHNYIQKIKNKHLLVHKQAEELRIMFDSLIQRTANTTSATKEKSRKAEGMGKKDGDKKWQ